MPTIHIPASMRPCIDNQATQWLPSSTIADIFNALKSRCPSLQTHLYDKEEHLHLYISVIINNQAIRNLKDDVTVVGEHDEVHIIDNTNPLESPQLRTEGLVTPEALAQELKEGRELVVVDVRELKDSQLSHLENAQLIPVGELPEHIHELDRNDELVVYCRSGGTRSSKALQLLQDAGFQHVRKLEGGILRWDSDVNE